MNCNVCQKEIDPDRAEFLALTNKEATCVDHSGEVRKVVFMEYDHKTAPSLVVVDGADSEAVRLATRAFRRELD